MANDQKVEILVGGLPVSALNPLPTVPGSGGGSTAVTIADGADVAEGAKADAAVTNPASSASVIALLKGGLTGLGTTADAAWSTGNGTEIALLKTVATAALSTDPVQTFASNSYFNITSNAPNTIKSGAGTLMSITTNNPGTTEVLTIYDNTAGSGTKIGTISVGTAATTLTYNVAFGTGLTIVSSGAGTGDWTVSYR